MKHTLLFLLFAITVSFPSFAQTDTTFVEVASKPCLTAKDSLMVALLRDIASESAVQSIPRYKLYKTENLYNFIKLDTATGKLWQVQYGMNNDSERMQVAIDDTSLLWLDDPVPGRYELYPTNNTYTFILLDTKYGYAYQVQWNTTPSKRFRIRIY